MYFITVSFTGNSSFCDQAIFISIFSEYMQWRKILGSIAGPCGERAVYGEDIWRTRDWWINSGIGKFLENLYNVPFLSLVEVFQRGCCNDFSLILLKTAVPLYFLDQSTSPWENLSMQTFLLLTVLRWESCWQLFLIIACSNHAQKAFRKLGKLNV